MSGVRLAYGRAVAVAAAALFLISLGVGPGAAPACAQSFTFPLSETFMGATAPGWVLGGTAVLTSGNPDTAGNGWLRLTRNTTYQAGYAFYSTSIPTGRGLVITFDYVAWGGTGADGLTFFLFDGATPTFNVGASGGSLGYAQKTGVAGLSNGYLGLGLDEFGNYSNPNEGRVGGPGFIPEAVAIRGPGTTTTGYTYLAGTANITKLSPALPKLDYTTGGSCGGAVVRPADTTYYRQVRITVTPVGSAYSVLVEMKFAKNATSWTKLFGPFTMPTSAPGNLKMGFAGSTGGSCNYHEIRNLNVTATVPDLTATKAVQNATTGGGSVSPGDELLYTVVLKNNTSAAISGASFADPIPDNTTYVANSATASSGTVSYTDAPATLNVTDIAVPGNGQATVTFKVQVNYPLAAGVTSINNQGSYTYGANSSQTDGDAVTAGNQSTAISVTAGPNFDTSTKTVSLFQDTAPLGDVSPADTLLYRVVLSNTGNQDSPSTTFTDVLPTNTTYVAGSATASRGTASYSSAAKTLTWTASINAGVQATLDFKVTVNAGVKIRDVISNQGTIAYNTTSVLTDSDLAAPGKQPAVLLVGGAATLTATKTASVLSSPLQPGGQVEYTVLLSNTGTYAVSGATFVDTVPANATYVASSATTTSGTASYSDSARTLNVTGIALASGATVTIRFRVQVDNPLPVGVTQIANQGVVNWDANQSGSNNTSLQTDGDAATAGQQPTLNPIANADLAVTKTVDNGTPAEDGTIVYTVRVTNNGPAAVTSVVVADALPAGLTLVSAIATQGSYTSPNWTVGALASGATATRTVHARVNLGQGGSTIDNHASVSSELYDAYPANNTASAGITVKTTSLSGTLTDAGTGAVLANVSVKVTDSQGHTCTVTTDAGGVYTVTSGQSGCLLAPGAATVEATAAPTGYLLTSTTPTIAAGVSNVQNLALVRPSLSGVVTDARSGAAIVGATVTLTQGLTTCETTSGAAGAYRFEAGAACNFVAGAATVTASRTGYETKGENPTILATGPTTQDLALDTTDLVITKTDGQTVANPGDELRYVITVENRGTIAATGVTIRDTPSTYLAYVSDTAAAAGLTPADPFPDAGGVYQWTLASLASGSSITFDLVMAVAGSLPDGETKLSNYAKVATESPDADRLNDEVSDVDSVTTHPDLTIAKTFTTTPPAGTGSTVAYALSGGNIGHATATSVTIVDTLDALVSYTVGSASLTINGSSASFTSVSYDADLHQLTMVLPSLVPEDTYGITYNGTVGTVTGAPLINTASISRAETDLDPANDSASVSLPTAQNVDVYVLKSAVAAPNPAVPGGEITYNLAYGNNGQDAASGVIIEDTLPANTSLVAGSITGGGTESGGVITWSLTGGLASQAKGTVSFKVTIADRLPAGTASIDNTASMSSTSTDAYLANNTSTIGVPVAAHPDLVITKSDGRTQVLAGDVLTYTIKYRNVGNRAVTGVTITDTLLNGVEIDADQLSGDTYGGSTPASTYTAPTVTEPGRLTWDIGSLSDFEEHEMTVTLKARTDAPASSVTANRIAIAEDGTNGTDPNPADNTATDSDVVIAPHIVLEKRASVDPGNPTGVAYTDQQVTYTIEWHNLGAAAAFDVVLEDPLPANTSLVGGSVTGGGIESDGTLTWNLGETPAGAGGSVSYTVTVDVGAGGATQTTPTLSTEAGSGNLTVVSRVGATDLRLKYQGEDGTPPSGWNDNPRLDAYDDSDSAGWVAPIASSIKESSYWTDPRNLSADWVAPNTDGHLEGNFTFFRQGFCLPLNATGLSATLELAGDDVSDIYLNGVYLGQEVGAGAASSFDGASGIQSGSNLLAVQLLNNRHGGHPFPDCPGCDHIGLLFNLQVTYTGLRPFVSAPSSVLANELATFAADELALGGSGPFQYKFEFGDGTVVDFQSSASYEHGYGAAGVYSATVTAKSPDGCTGTDQVVITVLSSGSNLLANPASIAYTDANAKALSGESGAGVELREAADLAIAKSVTAGGTVPGQGVTYQLVVGNNGPDTVTGAVVTDTVPAAVTGVTWSCVFSGGGSGDASGSGNALDETVDLPAGATATYSLTGTIDPAATGTLANTATVAPPSGVTDLEPDNNTSTASTPLTPSVGLSIGKTSSPKPGLAPDCGITYTIVVSNSGPSDAAGVGVVDTFPAALTGVTWTGAASSGSACTTSGAGNIDDTATLKAGGSLTYTVHGTVDPGAEAGTEIANTATASYETTLVEATDSNTLDAMTSLTATKDALASGGASSRTVPFIDADGNGGISPGDTLEYKVTIANTTAGAAYNVLYNDTPDANTTLVVGSVSCDPSGTITQGNTTGDRAVGVSVGSITGHGSVTLYYQVTVNATLPFQPAVLTNQGHLASANAAGLATDDPATPGATGDPTVLTLTMGSIGGVAWRDDDDDGVLDAGESWLANISVTLHYAGPDGVWDSGDDQVAYSLTDANGAYTFRNLTAGTYRVAFYQRTGFKFSPLGADNQADPTGLTGELTLEKNQPMTGINAGEVSQLDFGNLPPSFSATSLAQDGARHVALDGGPRLGIAILIENDGADGTPADNDGVTWPGQSWAPGGTITLTVTASGSSRLWAWFDWNDDGDFDDAGEAVDLGMISAGTQTVPLSIPSAWTIARLYVRFRLYPPDYAQEFTVYGVVSGGEVEDYWVTSGPTAARLEFFRATAIGGNQVALAWRTLLETETLGFKVDRSTGSGEWLRITHDLIAAQGFDRRPHNYELADANVMMLPGTKYRLLAVDLRGAEEVLAEAVLTQGLVAGAQFGADGLWIRIRGAADTRAVLETTTDVAQGPWVPVIDVRLDGTGAGEVTLSREHTDSERFYRLRQE